jgi:hypothetical protein
MTFLDDDQKSMAEFKAATQTKWMQSLAVLPFVIDLDGKYSCEFALNYI